MKTCLVYDTCLLLTVYKPKNIAISLMHEESGVCVLCEGLAWVGAGW